MPRRTAFHQHRQVSQPDTCICLVLEKAGVSVCWKEEGIGQLVQGSGNRGGEDSGKEPEGKKNWDFHLLFSNILKLVSTRPEILPAV